MGNMKNAKSWIPVVIAISFVCGLWIGYVFVNKSHRTKSSKKLDEIIELINNDYVDELSIDSLVEQSIPGILSNLDPHSIYIPASDLTEVTDELEGSFSGIGISFMVMNDSITVIEVISGGPSERVGVLAGDRIVTINGQNVVETELSADNVKSMLRGDKGTHVKIGIKRSNSEKLLTFDVERGDIPITSIDAKYMAAGEIGYVKVNKFGRTTYDEFITALNDLRQQGAAKFIVDLRGNGGGYMEMAILMANEFLPAYRQIVNTIGRVKSDDISVMSDGNGSFQTNELVVLLDEYSASASEIFSGAIQDNDRGIIIGRRSFGKGLVQRQIMLSDSSAVRLTIARYYTPSGRCIQKQYKPGEMSHYDMEILDRYNNGEVFVEDSIKFNKDLEYTTVNGRKVYGGGGIIPDVFVPNDTTGVTGYYINVVNAGLFQKFSMEYCDLNREDLNKCKSSAQLLGKLPSDAVLLQSFVSFVGQNGISPRWYYINRSQGRILSQLKALIARDALGSNAYYEIINQSDTMVQRAIKELESGNAKFPLK